MKLSPAVPGKLCESTLGGTLQQRYLIVSVHRAGQRQQSLQGFEGTTSAGNLSLAEIQADDWRVLGAVSEMPLSSFDGPQAVLVPVARRGPPITVMPGAGESAAERLKRSKSSLKAAGGARRSFNLTAPALKALQRIRVTRQRSATEKLDDTKVVNSLLLEENARLTAAKK